LASTAVASRKDGLDGNLSLSLVISAAAVADKDAFRLCPDDDMDIDGGIDKDTGANLTAGDFANSPAVKLEKRLPRTEAVKRFKWCLQLVLIFYVEMFSVRSAIFGD
jgi:hypothetical protein